MPESSGSSSSLWIAFALLAAASWGTYGVFLHSGQMSMGDPEHGRYKAFLWVGIAYLLIAVLAPAAILVTQQADWSMPSRGVLWSLLAGGAGAVGGFAVLLAFGARGHPAAVMSIIFACAPIVNAVVAIALHPPAGGWSSVRWQFLAGIVLAAVGGTMVALYKPPPGQPAASRPAPAATDPGN